MLSKPKLSCNLLVAGSNDPVKDENANLFVIELKPKGLNFHNVITEEDFQLSQVAETVDALREYLGKGKDFFSGKKNWHYVSSKEEADQLIKPLPSPFNDINAKVELCWIKADVVLDVAAQSICSIYDKAFTELELQKLHLEQLRVIRAVKGADRGLLKPDLVDSILRNQKLKEKT